MIAIILSIICFFLLFKALRSVESLEWGTHEKEWRPIKLALWIWLLIVIGCLIPAVNVFITVVLLIIIFVETRIGDLRFKGGKKIWLDKVIDFLSKEV